MAEPLRNDKHERFVQNLMRMPVWDVQRAYEQAGYKAEGESARVNGYRLLSDATVKERLRVLQEERAERTKVTADQVVHELALLAFSDIDDYLVDDDGRIQFREGAHPDARRAVSSVKRKILKHLPGDEDSPPAQIVETEVKVWNKNSALDSLGKHLGMFIERIDHTSGGKPISRLTIAPEDAPADGASD